MSWANESAFPNNFVDEQIGFSKKELATLILIGMLKYRDFSGATEYEVLDERLDHYSDMAVRLTNCVENCLST
jgi:hypothetical protein